MQNMDPSNLPGSVFNLLKPYLMDGGAALAGAAAQAAYGDLEISLHRRAGAASRAYSVETRFTPPGSASEMRLGADAPVEIELDAPALSRLINAFNSMGYGRALTAALFKPEPVKLAFSQALARSAAGALRLRLLFGPTAQELHALHWETLRNPLDDSPLAADARILFSRYLAGSGAREVTLRPKTALRALLAAANPVDLADYSLAAIDVDGELDRAAQSLKGARLTRLPSDTGGCTLPALVRGLQAGCDIFYLAAHGSLAQEQPWLWLEDENGKVQHVAGADLAGQVRLLENPPLLVVLASCESAGASTGAGNSDGDALQALGPLLCEAGVPAVIAMQGKIALQSIRRFMPVFFERLQQDGLVDRALAAARAVLAASGAPDAWMPALFMRLKDGSLWPPSAESAPPPLRKLWSLIGTRFAGKPAAEGAIEDLMADADDPDNQEAFTIQLKKALRDDPLFAGELSAIVAASQAGAASGGTVINIGGNVGGSIVFGNNNTIGNS